MEFQFCCLLLNIFVLISSNNAEEEEPKRCCQNRQYTIELKQRVSQSYKGLTSSNRLTSVEMNGIIYFDADAKIKFWNATLHISEDDDIHSGMFLDSQNSAVYLIQWEEKSCTRTDSEVPLDLCIPDDATYRGSHTMGGTMTVDGWNYKRKHPWKMDVTEFVTRESCIIVSGSQTQEIETSGVKYKQMISTTAVNYRNGVPEGALKLPAFCNKRMSDEL